MQVSIYEILKFIYYPELGNTDYVQFTVIFSILCSPSCTITLRNFVVPTRYLVTVSSYGKRVWFTESHTVLFLFYLLFYLLNLFLI